MKIQTASRHAAIATGIALMALASGCTDDVDNDSSNRGSGSDTAAISVENAFIVPTFVPGKCAIQVGGTGELKFTVTNNRQIERDQLLDISTDAGEVAIRAPGPTIEIPAGGTVAAGQPNPNGAPGPRLTVLIERMTDYAKPGNAVGVTFRFEKFGDLTTQVPIEACPVQSSP